MIRKVFPYLKAVAAALVPAFHLFIAANTDSVITGDEWRAIGFEMVGALLVLLVPAPGYRAPGEVARQPAQLRRQDVDPVFPVEEEPRRRMTHPEPPYDWGDPR